MKKLLFFLLCCSSPSAFAQSDEIQQLVMNVEKLAQLKEILSNLEKSYRILEGGYQTIKGLSEGNFKLHQVFLDRLLEVSPVVQDYQRVKVILTRQRQMIYGLEQLRRQALGPLPVEEYTYLEAAFRRLYEQSLAHVNSLTLLLTPRQLRMNDAERLSAIDVLYEQSEHQYRFMRQFTQQTKLLIESRQREKASLEGLQRLYSH